jgi:hypothetical protein
LNATGQPRSALLNSPCLSKLGPEASPYVRLTGRSNHAWDQGPRKAVPALLTAHRSAVDDAASPSLSVLRFGALVQSLELPSGVPQGKVRWYLLPNQYAPSQRAVSQSICAADRRRRFSWREAANWAGPSTTCAPIARIQTQWKAIGRVLLIVFFCSLIFSRELPKAPPRRAHDPAPKIPPPT